MSSLQSYLAAKYLTADPPTKKRKRKDKSSKLSSTTSGLIIADDDEPLSLSKTSNTNEEDEDGPVTLTDARGSGSGTFKSKKSGGWKTVGAPPPTDAEQAAADAIIASTAAENALQRQDDDEPTLDPSVVTLSDGTHAGLQTAAAVAAQQAAHKKREMAAWERESSGRKGGKAEGEETVYRDATGKRIDISMRRAQVRAEQEAQAKKEKEATELLKGEVQREQAQKRREELDEARFLTVARGVDDLEMNQELKERERWNDPMAKFLAKKTPKSTASSGSSGTASRTTKKSDKPVYQGAAPPNRYGIRPGYRWDGVDRGNGWEAERFRGLNRRERNKGLEYTWQMDE